MVACGREIRLVPDVESQRLRYLVFQTQIVIWHGHRFGPALVFDRSTPVVGFSASRSFPVPVSRGVRCPVPTIPWFGSPNLKGTQTWGSRQIGELEIGSCRLTCTLAGPV